jgi:hypothetical protein
MVKSRNVVLLNYHHGLAKPRSDDPSALSKEQIALMERE